MNKTEFFVLVSDYVDSVITAKETNMPEDRSRMTNLFLKVKEETDKYGEQARTKLLEQESRKVAMQELKDKLDLVEENEQTNDRV